MSDLTAQYDTLYEELSTMSSGLSEAAEVTQQLKGVVNGMPDNALGGPALMALVSYLTGVQQRLDQALRQYAALVQAGNEAVHVIEEADRGLEAIAPQW